MADALAEIRHRIARTEVDRRYFASAGKTVDAAACEIRVQAFREAIAIFEGRPLPPTMMRQSAGVRWAHAGDPATPTEARGG